MQNIPALFASAPQEEQDAGNDLTEGPDMGDDLTKEELASRFVEVLDHYQETNEMSQDDVCLSMLRTRLPQLRLNRCFVAPSTIPQAGLGLFASRDVARDEVITLYPGDALLKWGKDVGDFSGDVGVMFGNHITDRDASRVSTDEARGYELKIRTGHSLVADPLLADDPAYLGHMINDGSALLSKKHAARTQYSKDTYDCHNAAFEVMEGCHFATIATKNVSKGEEMFVSYGESYWLSRSHSVGAKSPNAKGVATASSRSKTEKAKKKSSKKKASKGASRGGGGFG